MRDAKKAKPVGPERTTLDLSDIQPALYNPRSISPEAMSGLKASIERFGLVQEIVVNRRNMRIIGGHQRVEVLRQSGQVKVPVVLVDLDDADEKALNVALNNPAIAGEFTPGLGAVLDEIRQHDAELFDRLRLDELAATVDIVEPELYGDPDDVPEPPAEPKTKPGDLWILGAHRLLCGDSTKNADVVRLMDGEKADLVFTDPPYGVSYADKNIYLNAIARGNRIQTEIKGDHKSISELSADIIYPAFCQIRKILKKKSSYYITAPQGGDLLMMMMMMQKAGLTLRHMLIWIKNNHVLGRTDYNYKHEPILFGWVDTHPFFGEGRHLFSTWEINKPHKSDLHPTMKPVELVENAILNSCPRGGIVADLFGGSGTTIIASEKTGRACRMMELDPAYCNVIVNRWELLTGKRATLEKA